MEDCSKMTEATETETEGKLEYKLLFDIWLWSPIICVILDMEMQCRNLIQMVCKSNNFILNVFMKRCLVLLKKKKIIWLKVLLKNIFLSSLALWNSPMWWNCTIRQLLFYSFSNLLSSIIISETKFVYTSLTWWF